MAVSDFHRAMADAAASGRTPNFRSTSPSTDDARYVAGNRARQEAERARNASNPSFGNFLKGLLGGKDPRARDRSTFRNPGPSQGILGEPGLLSGGSKLGVSDFVPFGGLLNYMTRRPVDSGATYTMNTQSGTGAYDPSRVNAMIAASQTPQSANPYSMSRAQASSPQAALAKMQDYGGYTPEPVETSPLLGYGFEEGKFGFDPTAPRATLDDLDIDLNPGYSQIADGQYVPSYDPFATSQVQLDIGPASSVDQFGEVVLEAFTGQPTADPADLTLEQWLQTEQGSRYNNPDLPEDFVRRMHEVAKRLYAGKF